MTKTKIEWCDYTINPVKGLCPMACSYCYARRMYKRFGWDSEIRFDSGVLADLNEIPDGSKIFWGSTFELFHNSVKDEWLEAIFAHVKEYKEFTHIFLTKQPQNLSKWSPFPDNCWVGVSATEPEQIRVTFKFLSQVQAKVKFISFEPLLGMIMPLYPLWISNSGVNWIIIGQQTPASKKNEPRIEWIREIAEAADKANIPVFLKDNLYNLLMLVPHEDLFWEDMSHLRQEFPQC